MKKIFKLLIMPLVLLSLTLNCFSVSAAFYTQQITNSSTLSQILNIVKQNDGQTCYNKMYHIFYNSQYAAAYNKSFPYLNSGSSYNYVMDNGTKYTLSGSSRGCYLYADYVSQYTYGISSHSNKCVTIKINTVAGTMTASQLKSAITTYAQAGEHIRIDGTHSIAFVAYTNDGFYYTSYYTDSNPKIYVAYTTWANFANECNSKSKIAMIYDIDRSTNSTVTSVSFEVPTSDHSNTITDKNAILWGKINKPSSASVTKLGIKVRVDGGSYSNGWSLYHAPSKSYSGDIYLYPYFNMNEELGLTLKHATKYYYQFYAVIDGKEYWSAEKSFTTTGTHSYGNWTTTKAATCTEVGTKTRKCTGCTKTEIENIAALGHSYSNSYTIDKSPGCTTEGSKSKHCIRCSATTGQTSIVAIGHTFGEWTTTKAATCTEAGTKMRKCSICSITETGAVAALGHNYSSWTTDTAATCTTAGSKSQHCSRCNSKANITTIPPFGHTWSKWSITTAATMTETGTKTRTCTKGCGVNETATIAKLASDGHAHNFGEWETVKQVTCTEDGSLERKCKQCEQSEGMTVSAKGHSFGEWEIINDATAEKDGLIERKCSDCDTKESGIIPKIDGYTVENTDTDKIISVNSSFENYWIYIIISSAVFLLGTVIVLIILCVEKKK